MPHHVTLDVADPDEVLRGAMTRGHTRAQLFRRGAGAVVAGGLVIGGLPAVAEGKPSAALDARVLNFALLLEYLESEFYVQAVAGGALSGRLLEFARTVRDHELAHVEFLAKALGSAAIPKPTFDFQGTTTDATKFAATAMVLEDLGVMAYDGQGYKLRPKTLAAAATIVSVEARHAAWIRHIMGVSPAPTDLNRQLGRNEVEAQVAATGFVKA
ncbi:ferritin-like domain-containing protein [Solirubrobacter sp. CPCC 204708]|uniref:Ferritin-like domain-containing protein n=1 Tax=Solirubrobacter deserti TaxID=2282478 RepID=A0ABT4RDL4_9ACTN|nr:ferritin-like domain-containing protein [Solirubrobacter deserti]MBE2314622.1 ferritin-like domain-containing protein [Solirubrobacter deserti]MDA0136629.1 ferritin-like domain-containing protein [Solirubrobacter deserti]